MEAKASKNFSMKKTIILASLALVALMLALSACDAIATIKPIDAPTGGTNLGGNVAGSAFRTSKGFDRVSYVNSIWDSKVVSTTFQDAKDLPVVLTALAVDPDAAGVKYGHKELGAPYNFIVKVDGQVSEVNTTSAVGFVALQVTGYNGPATVQVQVGPVLQGTSIRDGIGFIHFEQFLNQIEHAEVSEELNNRVLKVTLKGIDLTTLKGKSVTVYGIFTVNSQDPQKIIITPIKFDVKG